MPRGQKPKPEAIKKQEGYRGHRTKAEKREDWNGIGKPQVPPHLQADEKRLWVLICASLPDGVLSKADVLMLERCVVAWSRYRRCQKTILKDGELVEVNGVKVRHPLLVTMNMVAKEMHSTASELGLSPVARARISQSSLPEDDPMGWLMGGSDDEPVGKAN